MTWAGKGRVAVAGIGFSALTRRAEDNLGKLAFDAGIAVLELTTRSASLEDVFLEITEGEEEFKTNPQKGSEL